MCGLFTRFSRIRLNGGAIQSERKSDKAETNYQFNSTPEQTAIQLSINAISEETSPPYQSGDFNLLMEYVLTHEIGHTFTQIQNVTPWNGGHYGNGLTLLSGTYPIPPTLSVITTHDDEIIKMDPKNRLSTLP
jgi:hypothetical protein